MTDIFTGTVIRARSFRPGFLPSPVVTNTYFITSDGIDRFTLPVVSISTGKDSLFDYDNGIYTAGIDFVTWRANNPTAPFSNFAPGNFRRRGAESEREASIETFNPEGSLIISQGIGIRIHGGFSRTVPRKSLRLYARPDNEGINSIHFPFFPELRDRITGEPIESHRRLLLRNGGSLWNSILFRDAVQHELLRASELSVMVSLPVVHFINGEFWGIMILRERIDRFYLADHFRVDPDDVAILSNFGDLDEGSAQDQSDWLSLRSFVSSNSLANSTNLAVVEAQMDVDDFLRYHAAQIYVKNTDWPGNNVSFWRKRTPDLSRGAPKYHDGRWRWLVFDLDFGFGPYDNFDVSHDTLTFATATGGTAWPNPDWSTLILRKLLENDDAARRFKNSMADLINTVFIPSRVDALVDEFSARIAPDLPEHRARWRDSMDTDPTS